MVLPAKVFELKGDTDLGSIAQSLEGFREEESYEMSSGETVKLVTEVYDLGLKEDIVSGVFSRDFVSRRYYRHKMVETPITEEAPFWIKPFGKRAFMLSLIHI